MFNLENIKTPESFSKAVIGLSDQSLKTTSSQDKEPKLTMTTYSLSQAMQGIGLYKSPGMTYDIFNRELGNELQGLGQEALWSSRDEKLNPYDVFLDQVNSNTANIGANAAAGAAMNSAPSTGGVVETAIASAAGFVFPGEGGKDAWTISQHWANDKHGHPGVDLFAKDGNTAGKKMIAVKAGQVHLWPNDTFSGAGNMIQINHGDGLWTMYMHMSQLIVEDKSTVQQGQAIGIVGNTGDSRGAHIHFEVHTGIADGDFIRYSGSSGNVNPEPYIGL